MKTTLFHYWFLTTVIYLTSISPIYSYGNISSPARRQILKNLKKTGSTLTVAYLPFWTPASIQNSNANAATTTISVEAEIQLVKDSYTALTNLLDNWDKATIDCIYADIPRELLEQKNKAELLEKASTFALFDKSTSVVSCKKSNKIVRDYIGVTGKGPLVGIEKRLLKRSVVNEVDPDELETYFEYTEQFSAALSKASSLSYMAGVADFESVNTFAKGSDSEVSNGEGNSNLDQSKRAIGEAQTYLGKIVALLPGTETAT